MAMKWTEDPLPEAKPNLKQRTGLETASMMAQSPGMDGGMARPASSYQQAAGLPSAAELESDGTTDHTHDDGNEIGRGVKLAHKGDGEGDKNGIQRHCSQERVIRDAVVD
ncbi:hypothetical protein MMC07_004097 [Pseudocyphellaria aurata]|nr:hypothetical protein [Pseudocyphellaria aurata]